MTIGLEICNVTSLAVTQLVCIPPQNQPLSTDDYGIPTKTGLPLVVVNQKKLNNKINLNLPCLIFW